jgi:hypothetical protein
MNQNVDYLQRFNDLYNALNADRVWFSDPAPLRFSTITAVSCPGSLDGVATAIRTVSSEIRKLTGMTGVFNCTPNLRFIVAAVLVMNDDDASEYLAEVDRVRGLFRKAGLRRGGIYEAVAVLILRLQNNLRQIPSESVERFQAIYEEMKRYQWFLTGPEDFPACAMLVGEHGSPEEMGLKIEAIFQKLTSAGFPARDPLQTAAHLLFLSRACPDDSTGRYSGLASEFRDHGVSIWQSDYDELAILSFLDCPAGQIVKHVLENRLFMKQLRPRIDKLLTFSLASSITFLQLAGVDETCDSKHLTDIQSIIGLQQAVAAAAIDVGPH